MFGDKCLLGSSQSSVFALCKSFLDTAVLKLKIKKLNEPEILKLFFFFLGPHPWHMEVPRPGVQLEL